MRNMVEIRIPILMYHSISVNCTAKFVPFAIPPSEFALQMLHLRENGYQSLTVSELIRVYNGRSPSPVKPVVLTFDDGFRDFSTSALPILRRHKLAATLYVVSGFVGATSKWLTRIGEGSRPLATWSEIRSIQAAGIEIGAHSVTHRALDVLSPTEARNEIANSKSVIEQELGSPVRSFAYPFGHQNSRTRQLVREAGFSSACAVKYAMSTSEDDPFALARQIVRPGTDVSRFEAILSGAPPLLSLGLDRARSATWATLRQLRSFRG